MNPQFKPWLVRIGCLVLLFCTILPFMWIPELTGPAASISLVGMLIRDHELFLVFFLLGVILTLVFSFVGGNASESNPPGAKFKSLYVGQVITSLFSLVGLLLALWRWNGQFQQAAAGLYHALPAVGTLPLVVGYLLVAIGLFWQSVDIPRRIMPLPREATPVPISPPRLPEIEKVLPPAPPIQVELPLEQPEEFAATLPRPEPQPEVVLPPEVLPPPEPTLGKQEPSHVTIASTPTPTGSGPRLELVQGNLEQPVHPIAQPDFSIGRGLECDLIIPDRKIARQHARIYQAGGNWYIQAQALPEQVQSPGVGSAPAQWFVLVNGQPIQLVQLKSGDEIVIGEQVFRFYEN